MGLVNFGVPEDVVLWLKAQTGADRFIETGTYMGGTAMWAARNFPHVTSIELDEDLHRSAKERLKSFQNVDLRFGQSQEEIVRIVPALTQPAIFWLDAHWSGKNTAGEDLECPVLEEISVVDSGSTQHVILIDDASLFFNPPPPPHKPSHWPTIGNMTEQLRMKFPDAYICVLDDVIIRIPGSLRLAFEQFLGSKAAVGSRTTLAARIKRALMGR